MTWYEGLLVAQGARPGTAMFSAHIDRHGLVCTGPNEFQYAAFVAGNRSDLLGNSVSEKLMRKIVDRFQAVAVTAYEPWSGSYFGSGVIKRTYVCEYRNNLIFEVDGLEHLVAGTPVAFSDRLSISDGILSAQLDNVLCAAHLVHLFALGFQGTAFLPPRRKRAAAGAICWSGSAVLTAAPTSWWWWTPVPIRIARPPIGSRWCCAGATSTPASTRAPRRCWRNCAGSGG
ncbi:hypothetical protein [Microbulbifer taiwanensis]|uniref:hypothetical protein n=1 Tax=Microbulbifer taiwanensis TaxID=986746 RepID=UPI00361C70BA